MHADLPCNRVPKAPCVCLVPVLYQPTHFLAETLIQPVHDSLVTGAGLSPVHLTHTLSDPHPPTSLQDGRAGERKRIFFL